ncbi:hypothetical protein ACA910_012056 [Epithemia clementina (nom. ined.)]
MHRLRLGAAADKIFLARGAATRHGHHLLHIVVLHQLGSHSAISLRQLQNMRQWHGLGQGLYDPGTGWFRVPLWMVGQNHDTLPEAPRRAKRQEQNFASSARYLIPRTQNNHDTQGVCRPIVSGMVLHGLPGIVPNGQIIRVLLRRGAAVHFGLCFRPGFTHFLNHALRQVAVVQSLGQILQSRSATGTALHETKAALARWTNSSNHVGRYRNLGNELARGCRDSSFR